MNTTGKAVTEPNLSVWNGRRVFLTGHTGFKGSWLALWLASLGAQVRGFALDPATEPNLFTVAGVSEHVEDTRGDINSFPALLASLQEFRPEIVFHLAAQPLVRASYADPLNTYQTNVMGTAHLLEAVLRVGGVRAVVCVTSDKCYLNSEKDHGYVETDPLGGYDPYSSSKACAELVAAAYRQSFFSGSDSVCGIATARAGNVIGGGDWSPDRLLPDLLRSFSRGETATIRNPGSVRPWQHVLEPLWGYIQLAEELFRGNKGCAGAYNFGPDAEDTWPVRRVAATLAELWGGDARWRESVEKGVHEAGLLRLDASKAAAQLGWRQVLQVPDALLWTAQWSRAHQAGEDMQAVTLSQIQRYQAQLLSSTCDPA